MTRRSPEFCLRFIVGFTFLLSCAISAYLIIYYYNTDRLSTCQVIGSEMYKSNNEGDCGFIYLPNKNIYYYPCPRYSGYIRVEYFVKEDKKIELHRSLIQVQYNVENSTEFIRSLEDNYPKKSEFTCYYNKFHFEEVDFDYNGGWIIMLAVNMIICLLLAYCVGVLYKKSLL